MMNSNEQQVVVTISPEGKPTLEVKGVKGGTCTDITAAFKLGKATVEKKTNEFFETEKIPRVRRTKVGRG